MSVKPYNLVPELVEAMNKVGLNAKASESQQEVISILDSQQYQMVLQLTTIKVMQKGITNY